MMNILGVRHKPVKIIDISMKTNVGTPNSARKQPAFQEKKRKEKARGEVTYLVLLDAGLSF